MASKFKGNTLIQKLKFYLKSHLALALIVVGISFSVITFVVVILTREPNNLDRATAQDAPIRSSAPGGFIIPRGEDESSSSSSVSSISSSVSSSISFSSQSISSQSSINSSSSSSFINSSSSISFSSVFSSSSSLFSSSQNSLSSINPQSSSSSFSISSQNSSFSSSSLSSSRSSLSSNSAINSSTINSSSSFSSAQNSSSFSNNSIIAQSSSSSTINFDPNNPGNFGNPSKGDPVVPTNFTPPTTVRSGGFSTFAIILGLVLAIGGYVYYRQSGAKSLLSTTEKKLRK